MQTTDGGYLLSGHTVSFGAGDNDIYLVKTTSAGAISWTKTIGEIGTERSEYISATSDGGYIIAGFTNTFLSGVVSMIVVKITSSGTVSWAKRVDSNTMYPGEENFGKCIKQTSDGGYILSGDQGYSGNTGIGLIKLNSSGVFEWAKALGTTSVGQGNETQETSDGGYMVVAYDGEVTLFKTSSTGFPGCNSVGTFPEVNDITLIEGSGGTYFYGATVSSQSPTYKNQPTAITEYCYIAAVNSPLITDYSVEVSPNPVSNIVCLSYKLKKDEFIRASIIDSEGRELKLIVNESQRSGDYSYNINLSGLTNGVYYIQIESKEGQGLKKIIVAH